MLALVLFIFNRQGSSDILSQLQSKYGDVDVINATFQGHNSQKASLHTDNKTILLQVVRGVGQSSLANVIAELESKITQTENTLKYFDPYKGETVEYPVPDEFKFIKEEFSVKERGVTYYIVYANEIFSLFVFSEEQARFKGIASIFACGSDVYEIEIFSEINDFDKEYLLNKLAELYCI